MPKPFDATLKNLIAAYPGDWLRHLGVPVVEPVEVLSPDLSAVTAMADTLLKVGDRVIHIDIESGPDDGLASRLLLYNILAHRHSGLPVHSVAVLLRSNAKAANLTGDLAYAPQPQGEVRFRFEVVRVWERSMSDLFAGGPGLMPLAVLGKPPKGRSRAAAIPGTLKLIKEEANRTVPQEWADRIIAAALILAGMHIDRDALKAIIRRLPLMEENNAAIELFEEWGEVRSLRETLLVLGRERFGSPAADQERALAGIEDLDRLKRLRSRLLKAKDWAELLKVK